MKQRSTSPWSLNHDARGLSFPIAERLARPLLPDAVALRSRPPRVVAPRPRVASPRDPPPLASPSVGQGQTSGRDADPPALCVRGAPGLEPRGITYGGEERGTAPEPGRTARDPDQHGPPGAPVPRPVRPARAAARKQTID